MRPEALPDPDDIAAVARRHDVHLLLQHGSTVTGTAHAHSDLDLAVLLERAPAASDAVLDLLADMQRVFAGHELDLVVLNHADPLLLKRVTERCRLLYGSPARLRDLKIYAFKRYQDHRRFLDMEADYVRRAIAAAGR
jgi:predicted nucleotidyltransferase